MQEMNPEELSLYPSPFHVLKLSRKSFSTSKLSIETEYPAPHPDTYSPPVSHQNTLWVLPSVLPFLPVDQSSHSCIRDCYGEKTGGEIEPKEANPKMDSIQTLPLTQMMLQGSGILNKLVREARKRMERKERVASI